MKICICSDGYPSSGLPYSAFIQVLAREMVRQGCEVTVVAPQSLTNHFLRGGKLAPSHFEDSVQINDVSKSIQVYRPYTITFGEGKLGKWTPRFNRWATEKVIKRFKINPDVFYSHFWANGFNACRIARQLGMPLFVATGEDKISVNRFIDQTEVSQLCINTAGVICVSSKNLEESTSIGFTTKDKCTVLPNAYDPSEFYLMDKAAVRKEQNIPEDAFVVAFCGRFNNRKGAMRVAAAIRKLNDESIKSIFVGAPADNETELPECDGILFRGGLAHKDIVKYLNCADVFVLPSLAEGCPNSVIEAMACGLPIISSDLPFNYDILSHDTAILLDPENVDLIASAIKNLKDDEQLRYRLSQASINKASELTIDKRVSKILEFICRNAKK